MRLKINYNQYAELLYEVRYKYLICKVNTKKTPQKHHTWMIIVLLYRHTVKASERSVHRLTNLFHSSVKLFWLVGINVVGGIVYHLSRDTKWK